MHKKTAETLLSTISNGTPIKNLRSKVLFHLCLVTFISFLVSSQIIGQAISGQFRVLHISSGLYLNQSAPGNDGVVHLHSLNEEWTSQQWTLHEGEDGMNHLKCDWQNLYLSVPNNIIGTIPVIYTFNATWWSMQWVLEPSGSNNYRIKNRWSQTYLTKTGSDEISIQPLNTNNSDQLWSLESILDCQENHTLSTPIASGTQMTISVSDWIIASNSIATGANVNLSAGSEVNLLPGFELKFGGEIVINLEACNNSNPSSSLSNTSANAKTHNTYNFLNAFQNDPNQCVILGQNLGWSFEKYNETVVALKNQTGQWPGVIGGQMRYTNDEIDYPGLVALYADWQANGGIVELSMLPDNPWTGGSTWDRTVTDLWKLTSPGQDGYAAWRTQLDFYADILKEMQNAGVTVIWRPLMEMNGDWFWYGYVSGQDNRQAYIDLYRDMYDYFTNTKQLNNLIWVYSANMAYAGIPAVDYYYPGDSYVDITGLDVYQNNVALPISQYNTMVNLGKPFALTEFGPDHSNMDGSHDYEAFTNKIINDYPATIYALAWHDWPDHDVSWITNQKYSEAMNIPCVLTRDEMP